MTAIADTTPDLTALPRSATFMSPASLRIVVIDGHHDIGGEYIVNQVRPDSDGDILGSRIDDNRIAYFNVGRLHPVPEMAGDVVPVPVGWLTDPGQEGSVLTDNRAIVVDNLAASFEMGDDLARGHIVTFDDSREGGDGSGLGVYRSQHGRTFAGVPLNPQPEPGAYYVVWREQDSGFRIHYVGTMGGETRYRVTATSTWRNTVERHDGGEWTDHSPFQDGLNWARIDPEQVGKFGRGDVVKVGEDDNSLGLVVSTSGVNQYIVASEDASRPWRVCRDLDYADPERYGWGGPIPDEPGETDRSTGQALASDEEQVARRSALNAHIRRREAALEALNEALNEKADEQAWCGEYESIIEPLGFEPRRPSSTCYSLEVEATIIRTVTMSDTSASLDTAILDEVIGRGSLSEVSIEVRVEVNVTVHDGEQYESEDDAEAGVTEDDVERALREAGIEFDEVDDFNVTNATACD